MGLSPPISSICSSDDNTFIPVIALRSYLERKGSTIIYSFKIGNESPSSRMLVRLMNIPYRNGVFIGKHGTLYAYQGMLFTFMPFKILMCPVLERRDFDRLLSGEVKLRDIPPTYLISEQLLNDGKLFSSIRKSRFFEETIENNQKIIFCKSIEELAFKPMKINPPKFSTINEFEEYEEGLDSLIKQYKVSFTNDNVEITEIQEQKKQSQ